VSVGLDDIFDRKVKLSESYTHNNLLLSS
jgi:hypothetical protein